MFPKTRTDQSAILVLFRHWQQQDIGLSSLFQYT